MAKKNKMPILTPEDFGQGEDDLSKVVLSEIVEEKEVDDEFYSFRCTRTKLQYGDREGKGFIFSKGDLPKGIDRQDLTTLVKLGYFTK